MDKISKNFKIGCVPSYQVNQMPCGQTIYSGAPVGNLLCCDIMKLAVHLKEYEDLDMTPKEIRQLIRDSEELANRCVEYHNERCWFNMMSPKTWRVHVEDILSRASEYDEIKGIIEDGEDLADAYIKYRNRCVELEEEIKTATELTEYFRKEIVNMSVKYQAKSDADEKEIEELKKAVSDLRDRLNVKEEEDDECYPEVKEVCRKAMLYDQIVEALLGILMKKPSLDC